MKILCKNDVSGHHSWSSSRNSSHDSKTTYWITHYDFTTTIVLTSVDFRLRHAQLLEYDQPMTSLCWFAVGAARNCFYLMTLCANRKWKLAYCHALHLYPLGAHFVECRHCCCQSLLQYPQLEWTAATCSSHLCSLYQLLLVPQIRPCFVRHSTVRHCRQGGVQRWRVTWPCSKHLIIIMNACICQAVN